MKKKIKNWEEFKNNGFLWFVNSMLQLFGWSIFFEYDDNKQLINVFPSKTKFRGFPEKINTNGYKQLTEYINKNSEKLLEDLKD